MLPIESQCSLPLMAIYIYIYVQQSPTNVSDKTDVITFYNEHSSFVRHIIPDICCSLEGLEMNITKRCKVYIGLMSRVFTNVPGDRSSIPSRVIPKTQKMVLDDASLNTQQYMVSIKGSGAIQGME